MLSTTATHSGTFLNIRENVILKTLLLFKLVRKVMLNKRIENNDLDYLGLD